MYRYFALFLGLTIVKTGTGQAGKDPLVRYTFNGEKLKTEVESQGAKLYGTTPTEDRFGNAGYALFLQGNPDSYINLGNSPRLKPKRGSVSLWVKIDQPIYKGAGVEHNPILITRSHSGDDFNEALMVAYHFNLRKLNINTSYSETLQAYVYPATTTYLRQWYHIAVTYDNDFLNFYLNGKLEGNVRKGFESRFLASDSIVIGKREGPKNSRYLQGSVDDIEIYDRVLSPAEVKAMYDAPNPNQAAQWIRGLSVAALAFALLVLLRWFVKRRVSLALKTEKEKNDLINRAYEQEIKTLKTQMNPHFIFNALNTIQQFILVNDNDKAQQYLSKFSRLIRRILESSTADSIVLEDEIRLLKGYIEIESMRFNNVFEYEISVSDQLSGRQVKIPHFLIQPFVENAIWHGLLPKKGSKSLRVTFDLADEKTLACTIDDNGIGRAASASFRMPEGKQSLATEFVQQRLDLLSRNTGRRYGIFIIDKADGTGRSEGTKVVINIPVLN